MNFIIHHSRVEEVQDDFDTVLHFFFAELDLDYLERGGVGNMTVGGAPSVEPSPDSLDLIKVVLLGAPAVGKTSIIQVNTPLHR